MTFSSLRSWWARSPKPVAAPSHGSHAGSAVIRLGAAATVRLPLQPPPASGAVSRAGGQDSTRQGFERALMVARLDALHHQGDAGYQLLARAAARLCDAPIAAITLLDDTTQWIQGSVGVSFTYSALELSFCRHAIGSTELTVIGDTRADPRVAAHPLVMHAPNLRFYAGAPLVHPSGLVLGTVCVTDVRPRDLTAPQALALQWLATVAMQLLLQRAPARSACGLAGRRAA